MIATDVLLKKFQTFVLMSAHTHTHTKKENIYQNCVKHPQSSQNSKGWLSLLLFLAFMYAPNIFIYVKLQTTNLSWATENLTTLPHQHK